MDGQAYRDRIVSELGNMATSDGTQGASSGGSFAFTESDVRKVIKNWLSIVDSYEKSITNAQYVVQVQGPGLDFASMSFATKANTSGDALVKHLQRGREYSTYQAQLALNALNDYLGVEQMNITEFRRAQHSQGSED